MTDSERPTDIRILGGSPDASEIAAVTAVLTAALDEIAAEDRRRDTTRRTQWQVSQRPLRREVLSGSWTWHGRR